MIVELQFLSEEVTYHSKVNMRESVYDRLDKKDVENVQKGQ